MKKKTANRQIIAGIHQRSAIVIIDQRWWDVNQAGRMETEENERYPARQENKKKIVEAKRSNLLKKSGNVVPASTQKRQRNFFRCSG